MKNYIVYNSDGDILRTGRCADEDFDNQANSGESILEGIAADANQKIVDGKVVDKGSASKSNEEIMDEMRAQRTLLLELCDWTQLSDSSLSDDKKAEWKTYRQALRDLPTHAKWPNLESGDWPTLPS